MSVEKTHDGIDAAYTDIARATLAHMAGDDQQAIHHIEAAELSLSNVKRDLREATDER